MIARRLAATPGFRTLIIGGPQAGALFPDIAFHPVRPAIWWPGNVNIRFVAAISRKLRRLAPALIEVHDRPEIALQLARRFPLVPVTVLLNNDPQTMRAARTAAERAALLRRLARVMTASEYLRARFLEGVEAPQETVAVLPNCIDLAGLPPPQTQGEANICSPAAWCPTGPDMFVAACARALPQLPRWRAEMIGADRFAPASPDTEFLRGVRAVAQAGGVTMSGYHTRWGWKAMARAAIVVVPSRWPEPFGLTALEAMACGAALMCVPARRPARRWWATAARDIEPDNAPALPAAIVALAQDPARRAALGEGRAGARAAFDVRRARRRAGRAAAARCWRHGREPARGRPIYTPNTT